MSCQMSFKCCLSAFNWSGEVASEFGASRFLLPSLSLGPACFFDSVLLILHLSRGASNVLSEYL